MKKIEINDNAVQKLTGNMKLKKIAMAAAITLTTAFASGCGDSSQTDVSSKQEEKEVSYELWQEGTGAFPDREVLDKQGMDYAVIVDTYQKDENDDWELGMKGLTIYTGDPMYNGIGIGEAYVRKTPPKKLVFKKWLIIPAKYEVIDGVKRRFVSTTQEGYELGTFDKETPSIEFLKSLSDVYDEQKQFTLTV